VEIVGMGRAEYGDRPTSLRERGRGRRWMVDHPADIWKGEEQSAMGWRVRGWVEPTFDRPPLEVNDDHVVRRKRRVIYTARLDCECAPRPIERARIAEGEVDEAVPRQGDIGFVSFTLEFLEHRLVPAQARNPCAR